MEMQEQVQQLRQEKSSMSNEVQQLRQEKNDMRNEVQQLRQEKNDMRDEVQQLRQRVQNNNIRYETIERGSVVVSNEILGIGAYATVYVGDFYSTKVAVKEFHEIILSSYNMNILGREISIASQCRHPNLLQFICATQSNSDHLLIVTELMDMSLRDLIEQRASAESRLEYEEVKSISADVARGLHYLHSKTPRPIIHRDVSSANVLLSVVIGEVGRAKISDYGSANFIQVCNTANPGAVLYAAPEANRAQHDPKIDVFSYGVLVCEMCILKQPDPQDRKSQRKKISNAAIKKLVKTCTKEDPGKRPTMEEVIGSWQKIKK